MVKVSIIVPVYNSSDYIETCLDSLAGQSIDDIEIIFVDDHGTDDSMDKIKSFIAGYSGKKSFVLAQTLKNSGPGVARNVGIGLAKGEYLAFVDSDDYVEPTFCEELYGVAAANGADMACCDIKIGNDIKTNPDVYDKKYFLKHFVSYFTTFIYRKDLLESNSVRFPNGFSAEDTCFLTCCILSANKIVQIHKPLYHYILHEESVSKKKNRRRAFIRIHSIRSIKRFAKQRGLYTEYKGILNLILLKKGYGMAIKDIFTD